MPTLSGPGSPPPEAPDERDGMLDDPSLSRQWVARRLQRALSLERWGGPLREGLARLPGAAGTALEGHAESAGARAGRLEKLIRDTGSAPYPSRGVGAPLARGLASLLALIGRPLARRAAAALAEHTLSEYETLAAFVDGAPGAPAGLSEAAAALRDQVAHELKSLRFAQRDPL